MRPGITVVIPSIPPRGSMLTDALRSVTAGQVRQPDAVVVVIDHDRAGAGPTRDRGLAMVDTEWVAFLDDDDLLDSDHLLKLERCALDTGADLVYPWHRVAGGDSSFLKTKLCGALVPVFGVPFGDEQAAYLRERNFIPTPVLARTELARSCGGFTTEPNWHGNAHTGPYTEEWCWQLRMLDAGAKFVHLPEITWTWRHHGSNTSGLPDRW